MVYRLFFALKPPPVTARRIDHFARTLAPEADHILPAHQHVTMAITVDWRDYPYEHIRALMRAGTTVMAEPFDLSLDRLRISNRSAALCPSRSVEGLKALQARIAAAMERARVEAREGWRFSPHQTLFYRDARPEQRRIEGFGWHVAQFALVCSHVGRTRHETLASWPLEGDGQYRLF